MTQNVIKETIMFFTTENAFTNASFFFIHSSIPIIIFPIALKNHRNVSIILPLELPKVFINEEIAFFKMLNIENKPLNPVFIFSILSGPISSLLTKPLIDLVIDNSVFAVVGGNNS